MPSVRSTPMIRVVTNAVTISTAACAEGDEADAEDLAEQQLARRDHRQQHLDDARRLLPGHAR